MDMLSSQRAAQSPMGALLNPSVRPEWPCFVRPVPTSPQAQAVRSPSASSPALRGAAPGERYVVVRTGHIAVRQWAACPWLHRRADPKGETRVPIRNPEAPRSVDRAWVYARRHLQDQQQVPVDGGCGNQVARSGGGIAGIDPGGSRQALEAVKVQLPVLRAEPYGLSTAQVVAIAGHGGDKQALEAVKDQLPGCCAPHPMA